MTLGAFLLFPLQDEDSWIVERIQALGADDVEVRDRALEDLRGCGEAVVPFLKRELETATDAEVRCRLWEALRPFELEERRRRFRGEYVIGGFSAVLTAGKDAATGEIVLSLEIMNVSRERRNLVPVRRVSTDFPAGAGRLSGAQAKIVVTSLSGGEPRGRVRKEGFRCGGPPLDLSTEGLDPGESQVYSFRLNTPGSDFHQLSPGEYGAYAVYYAHGVVDDPPDDLWTRAVTFRVSE